LRRLFSTFARGWPGAGLLLMRLVAGTVLIDQAVTTLHSGLSIEPAMLEIFAAAAGILLLLGLWTPVAGVLVAVIEMSTIFSPGGDPSSHILLGTLGAALAMLGPGAWSVDARLFGWKRIDIGTRQS
jgi:putative oxidoreductase